jgi:hypothetical protein
VQPFSQAGKNGPRGWLRALAGFALLLPCGCLHNWWDNVTSRDLTWQERIWPKKEDPLEVIKSSSDGAKRAVAFASLREPKDPETRELFLKLLSTTALRDREPMCRIGAIRALGHFHDPRVCKVLENVYHGNDPEHPGTYTLRFSSDFNAHVRKEALAALENTGDPEARKLLIKAALQPPSEGSSVERRQVLDERLLAVSALAKFKQVDAVDALYFVFAKKDEDVGLHYRAHEALQASTGKHLPDDPKVWKDVLEGGDAVAHNPSFFERMLGKSHKPAASPLEQPMPGQPLPDTRNLATETPPPSNPGFFTRLTSWTRKDQPTPTPPNQ